MVGFFWDGPRSAVATQLVRYQVCREGPNEGQRDRNRPLAPSAGQRQQICGQGAAMREIKRLYVIGALQ